MKIEPFAYMGWAKREGTGTGVRLTRSSAPQIPPELLEPMADLFDLNELEPYGPPAIKELIAARHGITPDRVFLVPGGASMALFLIGATLLNPEDTILVENPGYESLYRFAQFPRARVRRFNRQFDQNSTPDLEAIKQGLAEGARMIVLTNLHNPTGTELGQDLLLEILEMATAAGARLICDEVFAEFLPPAERPAAAHVLCPAALTLSSFTKAFGLGSLRQGWILANPETVRQLEVAFDLMGVNSPTLPLLVLKRVLERESTVRNWLAEELAGVPAALNRLASNDRLDFSRPAGGVTIFPALVGCQDSTVICAQLANMGVHTVPGHFFTAPARIRLGLGFPPAELEAAISAFITALEKV